MIKAVITGDIIESSKLKPKNKAWLSEVLRRTLKVWDKDFTMKSELYRGDSFQCLLKKPVDALRVSLLIKTYIKSLNPSEIYDIYKRKNPQSPKTVLNTQWLFDTRLAIGIGEVDLEMKSIATSDGEAFYISGRLLDEIKNSKLTIAIRTSDVYNDELETELILLDNIISRTTALQCEVINLKLLGYTEIKIAKKLEIQQSAVNQRSNSAGWHAIDKMVKRFELIYG
jgi:hypothetical protein